MRPLLSMVSRRVVTEETSRPVATSGFYAGNAGAAISLMAWSH
jgi:hypothetical protein